MIPYTALLESLGPGLSLPLHCQRPGPILCVMYSTVHALLSLPKQTGPFCLQGDGRGGYVGPQAQE